MKGFVTAEHGHVVNALSPVDINGGAKTSDYFSLKNYHHVSIIISMGVVTGDTKITMWESADNGGVSKNLRIFDYYEEKAVAGDTFTTRKSVTVAATGFQTGTNNNTTFVIELDASELTDGYPYIAILTDGAATVTMISVAAVFSGARHAGDPAIETKTAIT